MQIHEVTQPGILRTIGQDIKGAVAQPFQKAAAVMSTPGAMTDPHAYRDAMNKYRAGQVAALEPQVQQKLSAQIAQQTQQRAKELAQQWAQYLKSKPQPSGRLKSAPTPIKPTGQYATKPPAGQVYGSNYPVKYKSPPPPAPQLNAPVTEQDEPVIIGGQTLDPKNPKDAQVLAQMRAQGKLPEPPPTQAKPVEPAKTGFAAVAGTTPPPGGKVRSAVTTAPKNVLTGSRAQEFKDWANKQLTSRVTGTNQTLSLKDITGKKEDPTSQKLAQLLPAIIMKNDMNAVEQYLTIAMQAMQQQAAQLKQSRRATTSGMADPTAQGVLDRYVDPVTKQKLQSLYKNPAYAEIIKKELGSS